MFSGRKTLITMTHPQPPAPERALREAIEEAIFLAGATATPSLVRRIMQAIASHLATGEDGRDVHAWGVFHNGIFQCARLRKIEAEAYASGYSTPAVIAPVSIRAAMSREGAGKPFAERVEDNAKKFFPSMYPEEPKPRRIAEEAPVGDGWELLPDGTALRSGDGFLHPDIPGAWVDFDCRPDMFRGSRQVVHSGWKWRRKLPDSPQSPTVGVEGQS